MCSSILLLDSLEHNPENDPEYTPVNEDAVDVDVAVDRGRSRKRANPDAWKGNIQKRRRMRGQSYLGRKKNEFINIEERKMEGRCLAEACRKSSKLHCTEIDEGKREKIFKYFWGKLDWKERKIYVKSLVEVSDVKRRRTEAVQSRRSASLCCFLCVDGKRLRVCQRMFLSTLGIKQWSVLKWVGRRDESPEKTARVRVRTEERDFLKSFLLELPKVPSHYCRSSSSKMYLEPLFKSINHLHSQYKQACAANGIQALSRQVFSNTFKELNLSLFHPKKDQCDTCCAFKAGNIEAAVWEEHCVKKDEARAEKDRDKQLANNTTLVACMDLQGLLLCPKLQASALYFKMKLSVHNFTIYNMASHEATNYLWHEGEGGVSANEFASCIVDYLETHLTYTEFILWSDGCGYQNRNLVLSNALLKFATERKKQVTQKYLQRGHTQMECDSVHSVIERKLRNRDVHVPAEYAAVIRGARSSPKPYELKYVDYSFFQDFSKVKICKSIRPGSKAGDPTVHDLRAVRYNVDGSMEFKLLHSDNWQPFTSPSLRKACVSVAPLYTSPQKIKALKFKHLQELKHVLPKDFHPFYDALDHE
ncbi:uncharacterized protein LOC130392188 isoform X2 [Gadus chalcogrammus]|uniref:uncharacterized protein LOC130392188 isoform X2 n=1 Tax=Gadus chalcogrammus TaxID=1042646 RepID=UPI0024C4C7EF|nr:uncharacterized protein LOC130392188 isoform X2 [Gadus chalcogrammus]